MAIRQFIGDLPNLDNYGREVAIDTETLGLNTKRDRLVRGATFRWRWQCGCGANPPLGIRIPQI